MSSLKRGLSENVKRINAKLKYSNALYSQNIHYLKAVLYHTHSKGQQIWGVIYNVITGTSFIKLWSMDGWMYFIPKVSLEITKSNGTGTRVTR